MTTGASAEGDVPREELPLPDYDHLPIGSLQHRIRTLDVDGLERLIVYEEAHAHRLPVLELLRHRLEELRAGATPSGGAPDAPMPEAPPPPSGEPPVTPARAGPTMNPPRHGVLPVPQQGEGPKPGG
jgi:hypothetical protein